MGQFTDFSQRKKEALKEKATDTFPSENGKQYKYPRPLMHLRLSICFWILRVESWCLAGKITKNKTLAARQQGLKLLCYHSTRGLHGSGMTVA